MQDPRLKRAPTRNGNIFLADGGMETTFVFHDNIDLPNFAAFVLMETEAGRQRISDYFAQYISIARSVGANFILETPTWRASPGWGSKMNYSEAGLADVNQRSVALMHDIRSQFETPDLAVSISGCLGPRGDGYVVGEKMSIAEARDYHAWQIGVLVESGVDFITAMTMNYSDEACGIAAAAQEHGVRSVISFTVETDGRLPSGETLEDAVLAVEEHTNKAPLYYMINCAHPSHFAEQLATDGAWIDRIWGVRANASKCSHAELDNATELDIGDPVDLGRRYQQLFNVLPNLVVLGGCCGTDHRHIGAIAKACCTSEAA